MKTRITELLGIEYPIICGGMARVGTGRLPAAVSNAGGLGMIGSGDMPGEILRAEIEKTRSLTDKPFGINLNRQSPNRDELREIAIEAKPALIAIGGGDPRPCIEPLQKAGIPFFPIVPSLKLAKRMDEMGAAGVVIEGLEAGGMGTGRAIAAALLMGADGVQLGTRFLVSEESPVHETYKQLLLQAGDDATTVVDWTRSNGDRVLKNGFSKKYIDMELSGESDEELAKLAAGAYRRGVMDRDLEMGSLAAGIICAKLKKIEPAKDIIDGLMAECEASLRKAPSLL